MEQCCCGGCPMLALIGRRRIVAPIVMLDRLLRRERMVTSIE
jgi:hypothetical protein